jgi:hypothetical protein
MNRREGALRGALCGDLSWGMEYGAGPGVQRHLADLFPAAP